MKPIFEIFKVTKKFWNFYIIITVFIVLIALLNLVNPLLNKSIVDIIVSSTQGKEADFNKLLFLLVLVLAFDIIVTIFTNIAGYLGDRLASVLKTELMKKYYDHVLDLEIEYYDNEQTGKIVSRLQRGIENITNFINAAVNNFLPYFLTAIITVIFLAFYSIEIAILLAILFPLYIIISEKSSKKWMKKQDKINKLNDIMFGRANEVVSSIRVVKSFISEKIESKFLQNKRKEIEEITKIQSSEYHNFDNLRRIILNLVLFGIYAYVIYFTFKGRYTIGEMTLLLQLVTQARFPLFAMSFILSQIQQASSGSKDFFDVLARDKKIEDKENAKILERVEGNIEFRDVFFAYDQNNESLSHNYILSDISFELSSGKKMAIVGMSGEGKSTLTNLLMRFYEPQTGSIEIDGININEVTQNSLHKNISVVLQESLLFSGTIMDNIRYGRPDASEKEVIEAAKAANADDFIQKFEKGYNSEIGERGIKLSGGQKQRISIARAILKDAPILILDEATSSLDSKAEHEVQKALDTLMHNRTTIIIAHRLSTIKNVDQIIVLQGGKIVEQGSPNELANTNGIYSELLKLQNLSAQEKKEDQKLKEFEMNV